MTEATKIAASLLEDDFDPKEFVMDRPVNYVIVMRSYDGIKYYYRQPQAQRELLWTRDRRLATAYSQREVADEVAEELARFKGYATGIISIEVEPQFIPFRL